jgi:hypothetical protein
LYCKACLMSERHTIERFFSILKPLHLPVALEIFPFTLFIVYICISNHITQFTFVFCAHSLLLFSRSVSYTTTHTQNREMRFTFADVYWIKKTYKNVKYHHTNSLELDSCGNRRNCEKISFYNHSSLNGVLSTSSVPHHLFLKYCFSTKS